ncbi:carboxypeptidase inhibitor SmCI-like [Gigantopelta aegis]|uniref:carboxypeptidase inhibitor SmCI-like n=1 Tax=Gigantopelta aegis TaxID=1735272 RepID=UPI001B88E452|nr:carboxypeptidase inhibitor SmCI-like [Gigantopelta aegis]
MIIAGIIVSVFASLVIADQRCSVTPDLEPCSANVNGLKYYFNATRGACTRASQWPTKMCLASGQGGFGDHMFCVHACECTQPPNENRCADGQTPNRPQVERWFFNPDSGVCEAFTNYGCSGVYSIFGKNEFVHESACKQKCICTKPLDTGRGDQHITSFAFNEQDKRCEEFSYKGEGGNANRFATSEDCMDKCLCGLEAQNGDGMMSCLAYFPTYVYNKNENLCKKFIYGGCGGNSNRFDTKEACSATCKKL